MKVVKLPAFSDQFTCELTEEMDRYKLHELRSSTYLMPFSRGIYVLRMAGCTRGCIKVDVFERITDILFYEEVCFTKLQSYSAGMKKLREKYLGATLEWEE